jgi:hypothetical protein
MMSRAPINQRVIRSLLERRLRSGRRDEVP